MIPFIMLASFVAGLPIAFLLLRAYYLHQKPPDNSPKAFLKSGLQNDSRRVAVLVGDSITHGRIGVSYADMVQDSLRGEVEVVNAGINSELAWNALQRVDEIIACNPDFVTVLIGTNDANAAMSPDSTEDYVRRMDLPREPTLEWYRESLSQLVDCLVRETDARIAVLSIPTLGESPQNLEYLTSKRYAEVAQEVAEDLNVSYLPLFEQMDEYISSNPSSPAYCFEKTFRGMLKALFSHYSLGRSWDSIADKCGFRYHIDFLHLNSKGAEIVAALVSEFIRNNL